MIFEVNNIIHVVVFNRILKGDTSQDDNISCQGGPLLLQAIIAQTPNVFSSPPVNPLADSYQEPQGNLQYSFVNCLSDQYP